MIRIQLQDRVSAGEQGRAEQGGAVSRPTQVDVAAQAPLAVPSLAVTPFVDLPCLVLALAPVFESLTTGKAR